MRVILFLLIILSANVFAQTSYIPGARTLRENGVEYDFGLDYFQPTSVVDERGNALSFADSMNYQRLDLNFTGKYAFTPEFEGMAALNTRMITTKEIIGEDQAAQEFVFNRSGVESATLGFKYGFAEEDGVKYAFEGWYKKALFANKDYTTGANPSEISMGDDTREIAIGINFYLRSKSDNFLSAKVLYRDPSQYLSSEIYSEFEAALAWQYVTFAVGMENVYSLETDSYSSDPENKPQVYNGVSEMYNSINRSWSAPYVKSHIALGQFWRIEGRYTQVMTGNSTDIGPRISIHLIKRTETVKEFAKRDSQFKEYTIEGTVSKISKNRSACVVDKGLADGLKEGMGVDFYHFDYVDGNQLVAHGVVVKSGASKAMVKIKKRYSKKRVEEGTVMRSGLISE